MRTKNPKCTNENSFKYSILISLHYYELNVHKERINQLNKYINNYNFISNNYKNFENNNPHISLTVYNELNEIIYNPINKSNNRAHIVKINNRHHAIKADKYKFMQLRQLLKQFTHKELTEYILTMLLNINTTFNTILCIRFDIFFTFT